MTKVNLELDIITLNFINKVAKLAGYDRDTIIGVILAMHLTKMELLKQGAKCEEKKVKKQTKK